MNILVTGNSGFIGKHLCARLCKEHNVFFLNRLHSLEDISGDNGNTFIFADNNIDTLADYLNEHQIDGIIHLASLYIQRHNSNEIPNLIHSNVYLGAAILEAASKANVKWFINTGTIWQNYRSAEGEDKYCPVNLYAATKQAFMDVAKYYSETTNVKICTLKLCDTYGPNDTRKKIIALLEEHAKSGEILRMSPGYQRIDLLHVDDVIDGFLHLAELMQNGEVLNDEYVLSSGNPITLRELVSKYEHKYNRHVNIEWGALPYREREVMVPYKGNILPGWNPKNVIL